MFAIPPVGDGADGYPVTREFLAAADALGFDVAWVAQQHFGFIGGLPSPFVFLASVAGELPRLRFGTAVVAMPAEHPVRVAEDAAVFESLHPGRLELGVGTGVDHADTAAVFTGADDRRGRFDASIEVLIGALQGQPLGGTRSALHPPAGTLVERLWESPSTAERAAMAGSRGSGLLISRMSADAEREQPMVDRYLRALPEGAEARVATFRLVLPGSTRQAALDVAGQLRAEVDAARAASGWPPDNRPLEAWLADGAAHVGSVSEVVESLGDDPLAAARTDLVCAYRLSRELLAPTIAAMECVVADVAPQLGGGRCG